MKDGDMEKNVNNRIRGTKMKQRSALEILFDCIISIKLKKISCKTNHKTSMFYCTALGN